MAKRSQDERLEAMRRGQLSGVIRAEIAQRTAAREARIVTNLVAIFRAGKLTHELAISGIAEIAGYRSLMGELESEVKQGIEAKEQEIAQAQNGYSEEGI